MNVTINSNESSSSRIEDNKHNKHGNEKNELKHIIPTSNPTQKPITSHQSSNTTESDSGDSESAPEPNSISTSEVTLNTSNPTSAKNTPNPSTEWDKLVIAANLNKPIDERIGNEESCTKLTVNALMAKLLNMKKNLTQEDVNHVEYFKFVIYTLFHSMNTNAISDRVKIIYLDSIINEICFSPSDIQTVPYTAHMNPNGDICVFGPNRIKNLVLQGGGGKGVGYVGMLKVLTEKKQLDHLEKVAGSSAGALAATAIAIGIKPDKLLDFTQNVVKAQNIDTDKVKTYFGTKDDVLFGINLDKTVIGIKYIDKCIAGSAAGIIQYIDEYIGNQMLQFLQNIVGDQASEETAFKNLHLEEIRRLRSLYNSRVSHRDSNTAIDPHSMMITFRDLETLSRVPISPNPFLSHLTITVYDNTRNTVVFCNAQNTPDMPVAVAARASMSLPFLFQPVTYKFPGTEKPSELRDGGICSNTPSEVFIKNENPLIKKIEQRKTLTAVFDKNGGYRAISEPEGFQDGTTNTDSVIDKSMWIGAGIKTSYTQNCQKENSKLNDTANIIPVGHGNLGTIDLNPSEGEIEEARLMSEAWTNNWVVQHANECASVDLCNIGDEFLRTLENYGIRFRDDKDENGKDAVHRVLPEIVKILAKHMFRKGQVLKKSDEDVAPIGHLLVPYIDMDQMIKSRPKSFNTTQIMCDSANETKNYIEDHTSKQMRLCAQSLDKDELEAVINNKITGNIDSIDYRIGLEWQKCCSSVYLELYPV